MVITDTTKKVLIWSGVAVAAGLTLWLIIRTVRRNRGVVVTPSTGDSRDAISEISEANRVQRETVEQATITQAKAQSLANQIKNAWGGMWNDDEDAVYAAIAQINNYSDWLLVVSAYGINSGVFSDSGLVDDLSSRLSGDEYEQVKTLLASKGVYI